MTQHNDRRLIEHYLPIERISAEARREKSVRKGHISTLHLWWARRPLVACRAAIFGPSDPATGLRPVRRNRLLGLSFQRRQRPLPSNQVQLSNEKWYPNFSSMPNAFHLLRV